MAYLQSEPEERPLTTRCVQHVGRGAQMRPPNRFQPIHLEAEEESQPEHVGSEPIRQKVPTVYLPDASQTLVTENDSPDVNFRYSINPYRGCSHGCSYCYARPSHEYLAMDAGLDFETRILVKHDAARLFRDWLQKHRGPCEPIALSGITDCYQPAEREFGVTRQILEVAWEAKQPMMIITKNALVTRDGDLLQAMAEHQLVSVAISVTSLDAELTRVMEPRTSSPAARLKAIQQLAQWQIPTRVMVAPVIPGLNDHEIPTILRAAREAGASSAGYVMLRLPTSVRPVFLDWLQQQLPGQATKVENAIRSVRDGQLNDSQFGRRQRGTGERAKQIEATFRLFSQQLGYQEREAPLNCADFCPPLPSAGQLRLF